MQTVINDYKLSGFSTNLDVLKMTGKKYDEIRRIPYSVQNEFYDVRK